MISRFPQTLPRRTAIIALVAVVCLFSTSGVAIKLMTLDGMTISGARSAIAALVMWLFIGRPKWTWSVAQVGGAVAYVLMQLFFIYSTQLTTATNAIFLQYTSPMFVAIFSVWYLKEVPRRADWLAMAAIIVGMFLLFGDALFAVFSPSANAGGTHLLGTVVAVMSGVSMAWFVLFLRKQKDGSLLESLLLGNVLGALLGAPAIWNSVQTGALLAFNNWGIILFLGLIQIGLAMVIYSIVLKNLTAVETVLVQTLEPVLNPIWVFIAVAELPTPLAAVGAAVVLVAVFVRSLYTAKG